MNFRIKSKLLPFNYINKINLYNENMCVYYMSNCKITPCSYNKAKQLNLTIKVGRYPLKKLDVYKDNGFLA